MTTETTLLVLILLGGIATLPGAYALYRQQGQRLDMTAAQQLEQELAGRLDRMHNRILKLEAENADLQNRYDALRTEMANLEHKNLTLTNAVRRLIRQIEGQGMKPEVSLDDLGKLLS